MYQKLLRMCVLSESPSPRSLSHGITPRLNQGKSTASWLIPYITGLMEVGTELILNSPIPTKVICFSRLLKCLRSSLANSLDPDQTAPIGAVCSVSTLFASTLNSPVMLGNYLQQTTSADNIFFLPFLRCNTI